MKEGLSSTCDQCGALAVADARYCSQCGGKLEKTSGVQTVSATQPARPPMEETLPQDTGTQNVQAGNERALQECEAQIRKRGAFLGGVIGVIGSILLLLAFWQHSHGMAFSRLLLAVVVTPVGLSAIGAQLALWQHRRGARLAKGADRSIRRVEQIRTWLMFIGGLVGGIIGFSIGLLVISVEREFGDSISLIALTLAAVSFVTGAFLGGALGYKIGVGIGNVLCWFSPTRFKSLTE